MRHILEQQPELHARVRVGRVGGACGAERGLCAFRVAAHAQQQVACRDGVGHQEWCLHHEEVTVSDAAAQCAAGWL